MSSIFGGKVPGLNAPLRFKDAVPDIEKMTSKDKLGNPEKLAFGRLEQQKGLSLFGDKDKDKVYNVFDCSPLDRMNQGFFDKVVNMWKGKGWVDKPGQVPPRLNLEKAQAEEALRQRPTIVQQDIAAAGRGLRTVGGALATGTKKLGAGLARGGSNVLYAAGVFKTPEERLALQQEKTKRMQSQAEVQKAVAEQRAKLMSQQALKQAYPDTYDRLVGRHVREATAPVEAGLGGFARNLSGAGYATMPVDQGAKFNMLMGTGGSGMGAYQMAQGLSGSGGYGMGAAAQLMQTAPSAVPFAVKVDELMGRGELAREWTAEHPAGVTPPVQVMPQQPAMPQQIPQVQQPVQVQSQPQLQAPKEPGKVWSPLSKKYVRYPRGPYRKRTTYPR